MFHWSKVIVIWGVAGMAGCGLHEDPADAGHRNQTSTVATDSAGVAAEMSPIVREPGDLTLEEVDAIVRQIVLDDSLEFDTICSRAEVLDFSGSYMSELSADEVRFMRRQNEHLKEWKVPRTGLQAYTWSGKRKDVMVVDSCDDRLLDYISVPLVSPDRTKVIMESGECCIFLGGGGRTMLYRKENGRWVRKKIYDPWAT